MKKILIISILTISLIFISMPRVEAKTLNDMYSELSKLEAQKKENENNKKMTQTEIDALDENITKIYKSIQTTIAEKAKAEENIVKSKEKIVEKNEESKALLKYLQTSTGSEAYLDYIFDAEDYTDFIYRYSIVSQLSEYNGKIMNELEELIKTLEQSKIDLANKTTKLEKERSELSKQKYKLSSQIGQFDESANDINEDIRDLKKEIDYYKNTLKCSDTIQLSECAKIPYAVGFKYPLVSSSVTSMYGDRCYWLNGKYKCDFHTGIDFGASEGTAVYAAAAGKVARIIWYNSCGGNKVYIYHTVNGKNYTTYYGHLFSINVSVGDIVYDTTMIGKSGGRSTASKNGGYDTCTTGAHLHFGIASGHNASSFNSYIINPSDIFTKLTYKYASWNSR